MSSIFNSFLLVFISEMGDKTQLLALILAARYKKPWPIMAGILVATIFNHALASYIGSFITAAVPADILRWALGAKYASPVFVTLGTTVGMLAADGLAVFFGNKFTDRIPMKWVHRISSALFILFGIAIAFKF